MGLYSGWCGARSGEDLKVIFVGAFFTSTRRAWFNRNLAAALLDEGVEVGIIHRGPRDWYLQGEEEEPFDLFENLEKAGLQEAGEPDFYLCWEDEEMGLSLRPVFRLGVANRDGGPCSCSVFEIKPPDASWRDAARALKQRLTFLREEPRRDKMPPLMLTVCLVADSLTPDPAEETGMDLWLGGDPGFKVEYLPLERVGEGDPGGWILLVEKGETLSLEDRGAFDAAFFSPEEQVVFLEATPLDAAGLEQLLVPSLRFFRKGARERLSPLVEAPSSFRGRWASVRVLRPLSLAPKRREKILAGWGRKLPAYHRHHLLAVDAAAMGRWQEAVVAFQMAYREAPEPYRALVLRNLSLALIEQERYQEAIGVLRNAAELYPGYSDLSYLTGLAHWRQKNYDEAFRELLSAAEKGGAIRWYYSDPGAGSYKPLFLVGEVYKEKGNLNGALTAYIGSLTYNSRFLPALERLRQTKLNQEVAFEVSELLQQLLELRQPEGERVLGVT